MAIPQDQLTLQKKLSAAFDLESTASSFELFVEQLAAAINDLILHDLNKLVSILYKIDIAEEKLAQLLRKAGGADAGRIIAQALIERQLQKIRNRPSGQSDPGIPDNEKW